MAEALRELADDLVKDHFDWDSLIKARALLAKLTGEQGKGG
jgi:hypothetical protein